MFPPALAIKVGYKGWPDRLVLIGPQRVLWFEFKQPGGRVAPIQKIRHKELRSFGHQVEIITDWKQAVAYVASARRAYKNSK